MSPRELAEKMIQVRAIDKGQRFEIWWISEDGSPVQFLDQNYDERAANGCLREMYVRQFARLLAFAARKVATGELEVPCP